MNKFKSYTCLVLVALLFGFSYIFQNSAANYMGPFTFGALRYFIGSLTLAPALFIKTELNNKKYIKAAFVLSFIFFIASGSQQISSGYTTSGKVGFISSMYIVLVPVVEFFLFKKKINKTVLLSLLMAVVGLCLLCDITSLRFNAYDLLVLVTALSYAFEIIYIDRIANHYNEYKLMAFAFVFATMMFVVVALIFEGFDISSLNKTYISILYVGIGAGALGYSLQLIGQKNIDGTIASIVMSFESVVSIVAGAIFLHEVLTFGQLVGCILMFGAIIVCIIGQKKKA